MPASTTEIRAGFFDSINGDRKYYASDMVMPYTRIVTEGIFGKNNTDEKATDFLVSKSSGDAQQVIVSKGMGLLNRRWFELEQDMPITIEQNTTLSQRVDSIIISCDNTNAGRHVSIDYRLGTGGTHPALVDTADIKELRICDITVQPNSSGGGITITDTRATSECPIIVGLLKELDAEDFLNQFKNTYNTWYAGVQAQWNEYFEDTGADWDSYFTTTKQAWETWLSQTNSTWESWLTQTQQEWDTWFENIKSDVGVGVLQQHFTYSGSGTVQITDYSNVTDTVIVYINGFYAIPTTEYTVSDAGAITFVNTINSGASIDVVIYRVGSSTPTT